MTRTVKFFLLFLGLVTFSMMAGERIKINLYLPKDEGFKLEERTFTADHEIALVGQILGELGKNSGGYYLPAPGRLKVRRVLYLDYPQSFYQRNRYGTLGETQLIGTIVNSLLELPGIDGVQFLMNGRTEEAAFGHIDTSLPFFEKIQY